MNESDRANVIAYRTQTALNTLKEVDQLIQHAYWNTAANRLYFACFHAISALLMKHHFNVSSHKGVRTLFGQEFVKKGKIDRNMAKYIRSCLIKDTPEIMQIFMITQEKRYLLSDSCRRVN